MRKEVLPLWKREKIRKLKMRSELLTLKQREKGGEERRTSLFNLIYSIGRRVCAIQERREKEGGGASHILSKK